jgi:hypothetical protein
VWRSRNYQQPDRALGHYRHTLQLFLVSLLCLRRSPSISACWPPTSQTRTAGIEQHSLLSEMSGLLMTLEYDWPAGAAAAIVIADPLWVPATASPIHSGTSLGAGTLSANTVFVYRFLVLARDSFFLLFLPSKYYTRLSCSLFYLHTFFSHLSRFSNSPSELVVFEICLFLSILSSV